ncbi:glycosyltransferase [bacterium]|nr:glycosyltransferase [bacterium]
MKLAVGFITYNKDSFKYLPYFLKSLIRETKEKGIDVKILAVDNSDSFFGNKKYLENNYPEIEIIFSGENIGFAKAYNLMISKVEDFCDYFLVINPDILIKENAVLELIRALDENKELKSVSPKILHWDFDCGGNSLGVIDTLGIIKKRGLKFVDKFQGKREFDKDNEVSEFNVGDKIIAPSGACGLYSVSALKEIKDNNGFFDERMFLYKEDVDLAYRLFKKGFKSKTIFSSVVLHDRSLKVKKGFLNDLLERKNKSKFGREQSFLNQHLIYFKYFKEESFLDKVIIICRIIASFFFALFFERFLLKNYIKLVSIISKEKRYNK